MEGKGKWWVIAIAVVLVMGMIGSCDGGGSTSKGGTGGSSGGYRCNNCGGDGWDSANGCSCVWCGGDERTSKNP